jgi:hypothetical protein
MFEFLGILAVSVLGLAMFSAGTRILLHVIFGNNIPPGLQRLANALDDVFEASAQTILGPFRFLRQTQIPPPQQTSLPPSDVKQLTKQ